MHISLIPRPLQFSGLGMRVELCSIKNCINYQLNNIFHCCIAHSWQPNIYAVTNLVPKTTQHPTWSTLIIYCGDLLLSLVTLNSGMCDDQSWQSWSNKSACSCTYQWGRHSRHFHKLCKLHSLWVQLQDYAVNVTRLIQINITRILH